jgi:hypothetical protein
MKLMGLKKIVWKLAGRKMLVLQKHAPEIMLVAGVVGVVGSAVLACRATLKVDVVIDDTKGKLDRIKKGKETMDEATYPQKSYLQDLTTTYVQAGMEFAKLYGPAVVLGTISIGCIVGSHGIMRKRNFAMIAAYKAVEKSFMDYRNRIINKFGTETDRLAKNGITQSELTTIEMDEKGKNKKTVKVVENIDPNNISEYAKLFDESNKNWSKDPFYNQTFLKTIQNYANDILTLRGHITLNEVYEMLGMEHSDAGLVVGWVKDCGVGDGYIDFGVFDNDGNPKARDFVAGFERSVLLDFNVDGVVYGLISGAKK